MPRPRDFQISPSLREKVFTLLSKYEPSDISYTIGAALFDKYNRLMSNAGQAVTNADRKRIMEKKAMLHKAAKRFLANAKNLKLLEMQY